MLHDPILRAAFAAVVAWESGGDFESGMRKGHRGEVEFFRMPEELLCERFELAMPEDFGEQANKFGDEAGEGCF